MLINCVHLKVIRTAIQIFSADQWMKTEEWNCKAEWKAFSVVRENGVTDVHLVDLPLAMRKRFWNEEHLSNPFQNAHASQHARFLLTVACNATTVPLLKWVFRYWRSYCHIWSKTTRCKNVSRCINHLNLADLLVKKVLSAIHHRAHTDHFCLLSVYWFFFWRCAALLLKRISKRYGILKHLDRFIFLAQYVYRASPDMPLHPESRTDSQSRNIYLVLFHVNHWISIKSTSWAGYHVHLVHVHVHFHLRGYEESQWDGWCDK